MLLSDLRAIDSDDTYAALRNDLAFWTPWARRALHVLGCPQPRAFRVPDASTNPVLIGDNGLVVKLYSEYWCGPDNLAREAEAYGVLNGHGLPVPELLGRGELLPDSPGWRWPFLVLSEVQGQPWRHAVSNSDRAGALVLAGQVGELLATLREVPLTGSDILHPKSKAFADLLRERRKAAVSDHRQWGYLSTGIIEQMDDFLPDVDDLLESMVPEFVHGDLHGNNVIIDVERNEVTGLIDFNDVYAGDFRYGLVQLHLATFHADRELLATTLATANWPVSPTFPQDMLVYTLLHDFEVLERVPLDLSSIEEMSELAHTLWGIA